MLDFYKEEDKEERCGFILNDGTILEVQNIHPEPESGFEIDPQETLRYINELAGVWHTHPKAPSVLSGDDKLYMEQWPQLSHYVIGNDGMREYRIEDGVLVNANYVPR